MSKLSSDVRGRGKVKMSALCQLRTLEILEAHLLMWLVIVDHFRWRRHKNVESASIIPIME